MFLRNETVKRRNGETERKQLGDGATGRVPGHGDAGGCPYGTKRCNGVSVCRGKTRNPELGTRNLSEASIWNLESKMNTYGRFFLILGAVFFVIGLLFLVSPKIPWLGRLPGDILIRRKNFTFYFPLATSIILSIIITVLINMFRK